jgi:hypothetical protein
VGPRTKAPLPSLEFGLLGTTPQLAGHFQISCLSEIVLSIRFGRRLVCEPVGKFEGEQRQGKRWCYAARLSTRYVAHAISWVQLRSPH